MSKPKIPNQRKANIAHKKRVEKYAQLIQQAYDNMAKEAARLARISDPDGSVPFRFSDYPLTKNAIVGMQTQLASDVKAIIMAGTSEEWKESNLLQDLIAKKVITAYTGSRRNGDEYERYFQTNPDALTAFQERKDEGMNLSTRVWNLSEQYKTELEESITAALTPGTSAMELAAQVKQYLKFPDKRFRRIKEKMEDGTIKWHLSNPAKDYHPGRGIYRSSARNAQRLARTEINMAYRTAEQERWKQFDFVVGYEVKTTQNGHHVADICDLLAGKYPKDFKFTGWHPNCMCYCIPILKTEEEFWAYDPENPQKSANEIAELPPNFREWVNDNRDRIEAAEKRGKLPYFIRDNREDVENILNPKPTYDSISQNSASINALAEELKRTGNLEGSSEMEDMEIMRQWWELSDEERLHVLEQGEFTGMISNEGSLEYASLYFPTSKENMLTTIQDELENVLQGYEMEDTNHYVIKFKGKDLVYSYDLSKPLTKAEINKLEWISANEGMSNYRYWAKNESALTDLMNQMAFCEYKDGKFIRSWNGKDALGETVSDNYRGNLFARTLDNIQTHLISQQFKGIESYTELSEKASRLLAKAVGNHVVVNIDPSLMPIDIAKSHLTELLSITKDYKITQGRLTEINLGYSPKDRTEYGVTTFTPTTGEKKISLSDIISSRDPKKAFGNSRCDTTRIQFSLASHEGGHLLLNYTAPTTFSFHIVRKEFNDVYRQYITEIADLFTKNMTDELNRVSIGDYGTVNGVGEFMAECFQEYRNSSHPSKYAKMVGKLIDRHFKK